MSDDTRIREWTTDMDVNARGNVYKNWDDYDKKQVWQDRGQRFLKGFIGNNKNRGSATAAAASGSKVKQAEKKVQNQFGQMGDDITIQQGYRDPGYTIAGTPGRKGFLGSIVKGVANVAMPGVGGAITSAVVGDRLDYM
jgi:hypothetical protein